MPLSNEALSAAAEASLAGELAAVLRRRSGDDEALANYERAIAACAEAGQVRNSIQLRGDMGLVLAGTGHLDGARAAAEAMREMAKASGDDAALGTALHSVADVLFERGRHAEAEALDREEFAILRDLGDGPVEVIARSSLGNLLRAGERLDEALVELETARRIQDAPR